MSTFDDKVPRPEIWKRVIVAEPLPSRHKTKSTRSNNGSFIKNGKRTTSTSKVLRTLHGNTVHHKTGDHNTGDHKKNRRKSKKKKRTTAHKTTEAKGKIIIGPRLQQRVNVEEENSKNSQAATFKDSKSTALDDLAQQPTDPQGESSDDVILKRLKLEEEANAAVHVDTRKIFSLTDVTLPTPVRSRLTNKRPTSSPATRSLGHTASPFSSHGSGMSAAKSLRPVSATALETALPKDNTEINLNSWFSKLEHAEQKAVNSQDEQHRMSEQVGAWEAKYHTLEHNVRERESEHHDRILSLQEEMAALKKENNDLKNDITHLHEARREVRDKVLWLLRDGVLNPLPLLVLLFSQVIITFRSRHVKCWKVMVVYF